MFKEPTVPEPVMVPCLRCGLDILTDRTINQISDDGTSTPVAARYICPDCKTETRRLAAEREIEAARAKERTKAALEALRSRVPRQQELDIGL